MRRGPGCAPRCFCPDDTPDINIREIAAQGADTWLVNGLINDCGRIVGAGKAATGWFDVSTLKEPYRIEGKKTMGLELAEQLGWELPDAIFYPTGGGTGLIGMWKAFNELEALGWIGPERPRMFAVQATGCAPIVRAWETGAEHAALWQNAQTVAAGIRVPVAVGDFLILRAVRQSGGAAMAVSDRDIMAMRDDVAREEGPVAVPRRRGNGGGLCAGARRRAGRPRRPDRAVELRDRVEIPDAAGHKPAGQGCGGGFHRSWRQAACRGRLTGRAGSARQGRL
jgi:threonine synthase